MSERGTGVETADENTTPATERYEFDLPPLTVANFLVSSQISYLLIMRKPLNARIQRNIVGTVAGMLIVFFLTFFLDIRSEIEIYSVRHNFGTTFEGITFTAGSILFVLIIISAASKRVNNAFSRSIIGNSESLSSNSKLCIDTYGFKFEYKNFSTKFSWKAYVGSVMKTENVHFTLENGWTFYIPIKQIEKYPGFLDFVERRGAPAPEAIPEASPPLP